jgi:anti-sigma B factor antagonist
VTGDVDAVTAPTLRQSLVETLAHPDVTDVLLDLSGVTFLDSAGLTALVVADRTARATGRALTVTCGTSRAVRRPLEITGLLTVLTVADRWPG